MRRLADRSQLARSLVWAAAAIPFLSACDSDSTETAEEPQVTGIVVSPEDFLGTIPCLDAPGAMRLYTAELVRVSLPTLAPGVEPGPEILRSGLVGCERGVAFGQVTTGATYAARVRAYDRSDLVLSGTGELDVIDPATNEIVAPCWSGSCGCLQGGSPSDPPSCDDSAVARAEYQTLRQVRRCSLSDAAPTPTQVTLLLDPTSAGSQIICGAGDEAVSSFAVYRDGELLREAACGETLTFPATPDEQFELEVLAYSGDEAAYGAVCRARALFGATVVMTCDRLSAFGGLEVPLAAAREALGATCSESLHNLSITLDDADMSALELSTVPCEGSVRFNNLAPGEVQISFSVERGGELLSARCSANVEPGLVARPECGE